MSLKFSFSNIIVEITFLYAFSLYSAERPNVVIIYGDDVGYGDVDIYESYGSKKIPTPNIDQLAKNGVLFTDGHCAASTCTPSRFSLLTGNAAFRYKGTDILPGNAKMAIPPDMFTLPDLFKQAGYTTAAFGKWHLGLGDGKKPINWNDEISPGPLDIGFDSCFLIPATADRVPCVYLRDRKIAGLDPADPIKVDYQHKLTDTYPDAVEHPEAMTFYKSTHSHNNSVINGIGRIGWMSGGKAALWNDEDIGDTLVKEAQDFIVKHQKEPFFIYFAASDIHVPRAPNSRFWGKSGLGYRGDAMVQFDWCIGELLKTLEKYSLITNTLVIFSSDNGPVYDDGYADGTEVYLSKQESDHGHDGSGIYRGGKYMIYEGGTRVPLIISWPGTIKPGTSDALVSQLDFIASFSSLLGIPLPAGAALDSQNVLSALLGKEPTGNNIILEQASGRIVALRQGRFKYIPTRPTTWVNTGHSAELFDLTRDPGESTNLITKLPEVAKEMDALLTKLKVEPLQIFNRNKPSNNNED